jgi:hypothetical protein
MVLTDTYDRRVQLDASRQRYQDALHLQKAERWNGAIYLGGYAIECSLKALVCYGNCTNNIKETRMFKKGVTGAQLHNLGTLREASDALKLAIKLDRTNKLNSAWNIIVDLWQKDMLRYGRDVGYKAECERFLEAVERLYFWILKAQGEDL